MKVAEPTLILFFSLFFCAGCVSNSSLVDSPDDEFVKEVVMIQGANDDIWFSGHQLVRIAMRYAEEQKLGFDFTDTEKIVLVNTSGRVNPFGPVFADVRFSSGIGKPF